MLKFIFSILFMALPSLVYAQECKQDDSYKGFAHVKFNNTGERRNVTIWYLPNSHMHITDHTAKGDDRDIHFHLSVPTSNNNCVLKGDVALIKNFYKSNNRTYVPYGTYEFKKKGPILTGFINSDLITFEVLVVDAATILL